MRTQSRLFRVAVFSVLAAGVLDVVTVLAAPVGLPLRVIAGVISAGAFALLVFALRRTDFGPGTYGDRRRNALFMTVVTVAIGLVVLWMHHFEVAFFIALGLVVGLVSVFRAPRAPG
jgi:hypothetical protein